MSDGVNRREFLKVTALGAAAAPASASALTLSSQPTVPLPDREVPTYCELCFWNCGVVAELRKGGVLKLRGHPEYPHTSGRLCARGNAGAAAVRDEDRLKHPMIRVGARGEGRFRRAGWPEAYRVIAQGFERIRQEHGARAVALFWHGAGGPLLRTMLAAWGSPNHAGPSYAQCKAARNVGWALTFGEKIGSPEPLDLEKTRCMVLFGSHLGENAHSGQVQEFVRARARGASLVVLDPRLSTVAAKADVWLPVKPGSDLAVLLAWIHLLVRDGTYDRAFVGARTVGFEALAAHVAGFTPEWAAREAGVPASDVERAYRLMVAAAPAVAVHPGRHTAWYGEQDTQRARGQAILAALLGAWWREGSTYRSEKPKLADFPAPELPDLPPDVDRAAKRFPFAHETTTNGIREATVTGEPYPVKGWFVHGTNLLQALPDTRRTIDAIDRLDLLVVCDVMPTEITRWADVLLPEDAYLERHDDLLAGGGREPFIGLRQPVVAPAHDTRPAWRIAKELGRELGVGDFFDFATFEEYLEVRLQGTGTSYAELSRRGVHRPGRRTPLYLADGEPFEFHTPSKKIELYSAQLADAGFDPLPVYRPQPEPRRGWLRLSYGRSPLHTFGRTQNNPILADLEPTNALWMNPADAQRRGLRDGARVTVANDRLDETGPLVLRATERIPEGTVYMVHGFGHRAPGLRRAHGRGGDDAALIASWVVDPISGSTGMRTELVEVFAAREVA